MISGALASLSAAGRGLGESLRAVSAPPPAYIHAARAVFAALLALWVAFQLELSTPYSAATTVLLVAHPVHGMVLSKSLYRLAGTVIGAVVAVALMGAFAQTPELFILGLSLWMGLCTATSTVLNNFRSYGAVLAGYTVVLICLPIVDTPQDIFNVAVNRVSVVTVGIVCSALVASLTTSRGALKTLETRLVVVLAALADYVRMALSSGDVLVMEKARRKLAGDIGALDSLIEYAVVEAPEIAGIGEGLRGAIMAMLGTMTIATSSHAALARIGAAARPQDLTDGILALIGRLADIVATKPEMAAVQSLKDDLAALGGRLEEALDARDRPSLAVLDRLGELLDEIGLCLSGLGVLLGQKPPADIVPVRLHAEWGWAAINGLRATITVWLAGVLWIATAWPGGATMVAMIIPNVGLLSLRSRPDVDSIDFIWGTLLATAAGLFCLVYVLPQISGFPLLALVLAPFLFEAVVATMTPGTVFIGVGFYVFFITLLAPSNPMTYDVETFLSNALATVAGAALTTVVYRLVLPVDRRRNVRALVRAIHADIERLTQQPEGIARAGWEARMHDRLTRLGSHMRAAGVAQDGLLRGGFAALRIGRELLRIRDLNLDPAGAALAGKALLALRRLGETPHLAVRTSDAVARDLLLLADGRPGQTALFRAAASFTEIAILLGRHRRFFQFSAKT
ncbi:FUSC family protein [Telmatospirillum siberiense]|uniref:FUSC family protein n=1 Tax=Telmatospirillum siberiense TaxID=382514 RepID=UPI001303FDE9|nr:FUSC family protein [Telmatospirillum siberiense]